MLKLDLKTYLLSTWCKTKHTQLTVYQLLFASARLSKPSKIVCFPFASGTERHALRILTNALIRMFTNCSTMLTFLLKLVTIVFTTRRNVARATNSNVLIFQITKMRVPCTDAILIRSTLRSQIISKVNSLLQLPFILLSQIKLVFAITMT